MRLGWLVLFSWLILNCHFVTFVPGFPAEDQAHTQILNPDGTPVEGAEVRLGKGMFSSVTMVDDGYVSKEVVTNVNALYRKLPADGLLAGTEHQAAEFVIITSPQGFLRMATSQIGECEQLRLQPWTTARVQHIVAGAPVAGSRVRIANTLTHDCLFQGMRLIAEATTDASGWAVFEKVPPGECAIQVGIRSDPETRRESNQRMTYAMLKSGDENRFVVGDGGRDVIGRVYLPKGFDRSSFAQLRGTIEGVGGAYNTIPLAIDGQGLFRAEDVPIGAVKVEIRMDPTARELRGYYGQRNFNCTEDGEELDGRLLLGTVRLEKWRQADADAPAAYERQAIDDSFQSTSQVAFMIPQAADGRNQFQLYSREGQFIRNVEDLEASGAWLTGNRLSMIDPPRKRCYALSSQDANGQWLVAFDEMGKQLYRVFLNTGSNRMAIDEDSGDIWLQGLKSLNDGNLSILNSQGELLEVQSQSGFSLCYSSFDKAFWMVGKSIEKHDAHTRKVIAALDLPEGVYSCCDVVAAPGGGCYAVEAHHPDVPTSRNSIWHIDSAGQEIGRLPLGNFRVNTLQVVGDELWLLGSPVRGLFTRPEWAGKLKRLSLDMQPLSESEANFSLLDAPFIDGQWGFADGQLVPLRVNASGQVVAGDG